MNDFIALNIGDKGPAPKSAWAASPDLQKRRNGASGLAVRTKLTRKRHNEETLPV